MHGTEGFEKQRHVEHGTQHGAVFERADGVYLKGGLRVLGGSQGRAIIGGRKKIESHHRRTALEAPAPAEAALVADSVADAEE